MLAGSKLQIYCLKSGFSLQFWTDSYFHAGFQEDDYVLRTYAVTGAMLPSPFGCPYSTPLHLLLVSGISPKFGTLLGYLRRQRSASV